MKASKNSILPIFITGSLLASMTLQTGCNTTEAGGTAGGAVIGGLIGSQLGDGGEANIIAGALLGGVIGNLVTKHYIASQEQKQVAEANARAAVLQYQQEQEALKLKAQSNPSVEYVEQELPRYIAVETAAPEDTQLAQGAKQQVMLWDVQSQALVGEKVYNLSDTPSSGQTLDFGDLQDAMFLDS